MRLAILMAIMALAHVAQPKIIERHYHYHFEGEEGAQEEGGQAQQGQAAEPDFEKLGNNIKGWLGKGYSWERLRDKTRWLNDLDASFSYGDPNDNIKMMMGMAGGQYYPKLTCGEAAQLIERLSEGQVKAADLESENCK